MVPLIEKLDYPFSHADALFADQIEAMAQTWIDWLDLPGEFAYKYKKSRLANLATRFFPHASLPVLEAAGLHLVLFFAFDDLYANKNLLQLQVHSNQAIENLQGHHLKHVPNVIRAFTALREKLLELTNDQWLQRFILNVQRYFDAMLAEAFISSSGIYPSIRYYTIIRENLVGLYQLVDFLEPERDFVFPTEIVTSPYFCRLRKSAVLIMSWLNDIVSYPKEYRDGEIFNLVLVTAREKGYAIDEAMERAINLHNREIEHFIRICNNPPDFGEYNREVNRYISDLQFMITGHKVWSELTYRYNSPI
ncbi:MAG TPA: hypothetical protein VM802_08305 [Chitinophaga sp.]|uniref:terpene synthase family protein n=1 Tax=Chitinophaga sp. TaxID=1869181 RepID=UPI002BA1B80B|nr:hypothetical protein [Chitinophaga sp.]HVI44858.1 hypothetical protein [Chitinophaga sp.]